jgi:hypothetical protein
VALPAVRVRKWFLRAVYRNADPSTEEGRGAYLDGIDDVVMRQITAGGKRLTSASSTGTSSSYEFAEDMGLEDIAALTEWARDFIAEDAVADAIALVLPPVRYVSTSFARLVH